MQQAMLYNDHSPYTAALLVPDPEAIKAYRKRNPHPKPDEILELFQEALTRFRDDADLKERFPSQWVPSSFLLINEPLSLENGFLNFTSKMVRHKIAEAYQEGIDYLYSDEGREYTNPRNRQAAEKLIT